MTYDVIIRKEHCEGRSYMDNNNCPLCAAIREQLPEFPLKAVLGDRLMDDKGNVFLFPAKNNFDDMECDKWNILTMLKLRSGEISEHKVIFTLEEQQSKEQEVQECDTRDDAKPVAAGYIKEFSPIKFEKIKELIPQLSNS